MAYSFPNRLNTLFTLMLPTAKETDYGTVVNGYKPDIAFWTSKRTFNGTEEVINGVMVIKNTAVIDCYYNPKITTNCRLKDREGRQWRIISVPENINGNGQYMQFKIECIEGVDKGV